MSRHHSIDLLRGFIMIIMAIDHASGLIARVHFNEIWGIPFEGYPSMGWWFTRFISHLCAPGFFMLMGMSIYLFARKRIQADWTAGQIRSYFFKRGGIILLIMFFLELPAWGLGFAFGDVQPVGGGMPGDPSASFVIPCTVLFGLGMSMMISGLLWQLKSWQWLAISITSFVASGLLIMNLSPDGAFNPLLHFLIIPGASTGALVIYPIIPWLGVTTFGMWLGHLLATKGDRLYPIALQLGCAFVATAIGLRFMDVGNLTFEDHTDLISFFSLVKYPPSAVFILFTCGVNLIFLYIFSRLTTQNWLKPVKVFGQTAMFFYIVHLFLYAIISIAFPKGADLGTMYALWLLGLGILYVICRRFQTFKSATSLHSFWRMI